MTQAMSIGGYVTSVIFYSDSCCEAMTFEWRILGGNINLFGNGCS